VARTVRARLAAFAAYNYASKRALIVAVPTRRAGISHFSSPIIPVVRAFIQDRRSPGIEGRAWNGKKDENNEEGQQILKKHRFKCVWEEVDFAQK